AEADVTSKVETHRVDQDIAIIGRVKLPLAAHRRYPDAIAVAADPGDDAAQEMPRFRMVRAAKAQRVQHRNGARAHREDVAQDAADSGRRALIGLYKGGMVVALDLEDDGLAIADIDDSGILARAADDARPRRRQGLQPYLR